MNRIFLVLLLTGFAISPAMAQGQGQGSGGAGNQLIVLEGFADEVTGQLTLLADSFDFPSVTLGADPTPLTIVSNDGATLVLELPADLVPGDYRISIEDGNARGSFDFTFGAVGPVGPTGPQGPPGEDGITGLSAILCANDWTLSPPAENRIRTCNCPAGMVAIQCSVAVNSASLDDPLAIRQIAIVGGIGPQCLVRAVKLGPITLLDGVERWDITIRNLCIPAP